MPAKSKAQLRWAYAHEKDKSKAGAAAREMIEKTHSASKLPEKKRKGK